MTSLKELRDRLKSIQSTKKVTSAMRVVAAAKFRSSRLKMESSRIYQAEMLKIFRAIADNSMLIEHPPLLLNGPKPISFYFDPWTEYRDRYTHQYTVLLGIITSDRGLCAGYNTGLLKKVRYWIEEHQNIGHKVKLLCIGKKGYDALKKEYGLYINHYLPFADLLEKPTALAELADYIEKLYNDREFDYADMAYTYFKNTLTQVVTIEGLLPLNRIISAGLTKEVYEFEPILEKISTVFVQDYFKVHLNHLLFESMTSENAARMTAMDNATRNAQKIMNQLKLTYNRSRQAHITTELIEIIAGAEAL